MLVEQIMTRDVVTVNPHTPLIEALQLSRARRIRHFPVMQGQELVGIVSDRDMRDICPSILDPNWESAVRSLHIRDCMKRDVITVHPWDFIEDAAAEMFRQRVSCLPVVQDGKLVGILTERDILHTLIDMMGVLAPSSRIEVELPNRPGGLADVADILRARKVNACSVLVFPGDTPQTRRLVLRVQTMDPRHIIDDITAAGYRVIGPLRTGGRAG
ncbi:MAG: acetoin utilization AcuB family protein [Alicyclobacillaceae bacterium]|nr:acetoin utilization AcuB family protein [Alicyclobacillaceae bacterium]